MTGQSQGPRFNNQLPRDDSPRTMNVKLSQTITMRCTGCGYHGFAKIVTGRSTFPLYLCARCSRVAQTIVSVKDK